MPSPAALAHLSKDPVMRRLIRRVGACGLAVDRRSPYEALVRAVTYQQLNGRAAETILGRVIACCDDGRFPSPATVLAVRAATLRRAGLSRAKTLAIKDIARHAAAGTVPTRRATARMSDEEIIEQLTAIRGVGRWTVEMLLMFTLGRPDVMPVDDFGVREGYRAAYGLAAQPSLNALREYGKRWSPYRSTAAWYLWRAADEARRARRQAARP
ncbi:MAG TPA: DNA-3-methyladenine glycosylase 2 family protein [Candidatus Limnocylindria bacterium]|nr:DNA-3-methyladenine glycosylase 2 family protein [Candidatus Limnocylindria bacterium]